MYRVTGGVLLGLLAALASAVPAAAQERADAVASVRFDERQAADLLRRNGGQMNVADLLRQVGSVEVRAKAPARMILAVYLMRGKDVVRRYTTSEFEAPARGAIPLRQVLRDGDPPFGEFSLDPGHLLEAVELVPARAAIEEPGRFVINGVIPFHPKDWEEMTAIYIVAAPLGTKRPTDTRGDNGWPVSSTASAGIGVMFASPAWP